MKHTRAESEFMKSANTPELAVATVQPLPVAAAAETGISIESAYRAVVEGKIDEKNLEVMKQLLAMDAERRFNAAFVALQAEIPVIVAESQIPNRGRYQRYEDIMQKDGVARLLGKHGFTVSFTQEYVGNLVTVTCLLRHAGGHSHPTSFSVRVGGKADSDTQADCKASTTAKRNALCQALNITIRQDVLMDGENDASLVGNLTELVTTEQADELERRVHETNSNVIAFLQYAGAKTFSAIPAHKYEALDALLRKKEQGGR